MDLKLWRPAIVNHLYWMATSTPNGDPDVMEAKWQSMINQCSGHHEHNTPAFPCCAHPPLEGEARVKEWLEPGKTYHRGPCLAIRPRPLAKPLKYVNLCQSSQACEVWCILNKIY